MSDSNTIQVRSGIGLSTLLTVLFVALKLTGHINWSWAWVLAPLWLSWALFFFAVGVALMIYLLVER